MKVKRIAVTVSADDGIDEFTFDITRIVGCNLQFSQPVKSKDANTRWLLDPIKEVELDGVRGEVKRDSMKVWTKAAQQSRRHIGRERYGFHQRWLRDQGPGSGAKIQPVVKLHAFIPFLAYFPKMELSSLSSF